MRPQCIMGFNVSPESLFNKRPRGKKNILGVFYSSLVDRGLFASPAMGSAGQYPNRFRELVDRLSKRLVLDSRNDEPKRAYGAISLDWELAEDNHSPPAVGQVCIKETSHGYQSCCTYARFEYRNGEYAHGIYRALLWSIR